MRDGNVEHEGAGQGTRDAGDDRAVDARVLARHKLLAATAVHEGIALFEPHDCFPFARSVQCLSNELRLSSFGIAGELFGDHERRRRWQQSKNGGGYELIRQDEIRVGRHEDLFGSHGEQCRMPGARAK